MPEQSKLELVLTENKLDPAETQSEQKIFSPFFAQVEKMKGACESLVIKSIDQVDEMEKARELRLTLKKIRIAGKEEKDKLKEVPLRKCQAIDALHRYLVSEIKPLEIHLQKQEDFIEEERMRIRAEKEEARKVELDKYGVDYAFVDLRTMPEENFQTYLKNSKRDFDMKKKAEEKEAAEEAKREKEEQAAKLKKEKEDAAERERIEEENRQLKKDAEEREEKGEKERIARKEFEDMERKKQEAKLKTEREKREKAEADLKKKADDEARIKKEDAEREKKETAEIAKREKEAKLAPDKVKLQNLAVQIAGLEMPEVKTEEAKKVIVAVVELLNKTSNYINEKNITL